MTHDDTHSDDRRLWQTLGARALPGIAWMISRSPHFWMTAFPLRNARPSKLIWPHATTAFANGPNSTH